MRNNKETIKILRDEAISAFNTIKSDFIELEKGYLAKIDDNVKDYLKRHGKSHIEQKIIFAKVRKIERELMKTYFSNSRLADVEVVGRPELTEILQNELDCLSNQKLNLYTSIRQNITQMLVYGTSIVKVYFDTKTNCVKIQPKRINEVLIDPYAKSHFDAKYFVDCFYMSVGDIKRIFKKNVKNIDFDNLDNTNATLLQKKAQNNNLGDYKRILIHEIYRKIGDDWYLSTMINDEFIRCDVKLKDGHPFCFGIAFPQFVRIDETNAIRSYGASYIEPMIPIQKQFIVTRNQQMDAIYMQLHPRLLCERNSGLRDDDLKLNSQKIVVNNLASIKDLPVPHLSDSIFDVNQLDTELQEVGGLPKLLQGLTSTGMPRNATGMNILNESGNAVIDDIITSYNESFFEPFIQRILKLTYKYKIDERFVNFDRRSDISLKINVNAGVGAMSRDVKLNNLSASKNSLMTMEKMLLEAGLTDKAFEYIKVLDSLTKDELKALGTKNTDELISLGIKEPTQTQETQIPQLSEQQ